MPLSSQALTLSKRMLQSLLFILVSVWVLLSLLLYIFQPKFVYFPQAEVEQTPDLAELFYEDIYFKTEDDVSLNGWYIPAPNAKKTVLFFHGNGGNISHRLQSLKIFHDMGLSVFIIDYRGYGKSQGVTGEQGTYKDADAAWKYLTETRGIAEKDIIIFGRSMGGAIAIWLASQHTADLLILESTFTSIADMGQHYYPYLPAKLLTRIKYPSIDRIQKINCPVLIAHSQTDEIVPYKLGQALFDEAPSPKMFMQLKGGHNDGFITSGTDYIAGIEEFIERYSEYKQ